MGGEDRERGGGTGAGLNSGDRVMAGGKGAGGKVVGGGVETALACSAERVGGGDPAS